MPSSRRDYILRLIDQLAVVLNRLRGQVGGGGAAAPSELVREAQDLQSSLLGPMAGLMPRLDPRSAALLLGDARQVGFWAESLRVEAAARRLQGEEDLATALEARALALDQAASEMEEGG